MDRIARRPTFPLLACLAAVLLSAVNLPLATATEPASLLLLDSAALASARDAIAEGDHPHSAALDALRADADKALKQKPLTVIDKPFTPPSGDKRDYMSVGPYWWPDPNQPDGLPYIRRDGETNPDRHKYDSSTMSKMVGAVSDLALAYYFTGHEPYAEHAVRLLRVWFLDESTGMTPHLRYGQAIPGRNDGRYIGIIDTVRLIDLLDPVLLLEASPAFPREDQQALRGWFRQYLDWLLNHQFGAQERNHPNNHGSWYDVQVTSFALYAGDRDTARRVTQAAGKRRIARQIEPDGRQPHELDRTKGFSYSCYNLLALIKLATLAEQVDVDLWSFTTDDGRSLQAALDWLAPFATGEQAFEYQQIGSMNPSRAYEIYLRAAAAYPAADYAAVADQLDEGDRAARLNLSFDVPR